MDSTSPAKNPPQVSLHPVNRENWRAVARLQVTDAQREFVAEPCYYLALCNYGGDWHPLAICVEEQVIGFMMWAVDEKDGSCWLGGILVDAAVQGRGFGGQAVREAVSMLTREHGYRHFALSYQPANAAARQLYEKLGFMETTEWEDDEVVARLSLPG
ncbi:GNAT family N-acetyltransferase [Levilinea saccharolytica]|uniref:N-acetyltransferase domain-containing protein n=1 Tax=Levilinea saccharolytica TaxID=229921 RepID=A0A0N8GMM2_9CHLR|nr:GNAT family N-acetyltransferase [Levilinea saccharolytica]KPL75690.1 hypothetical protein ADN01_17840 [Levilinea saccharolytica]GAP16631.1 acetyltransferase, including N-acetylase of ribosomal proteins [Levilinea saccharolytica]